MKSVLLLLGGAAVLLTAMPAMAQGGTYRTRTVLVYGDDPCPKSENPDEIIVCARRPEEERFRIPRELRETDRSIRPQDNVPAQRAALATPRESFVGTGSCSMTGAGGFTGCTQGLDVVEGVRTIRRGVETALEPTDD
jgi:hypothetical protein